MSISLLYIFLLRSWYIKFWKKTPQQIMSVAYFAYYVVSMKIQWAGWSQFSLQLDGSEMLPSQAVFAVSKSGFLALFVGQWVPGSLLVLNGPPENVMSIMTMSPISTESFFLVCALGLGFCGLGWSSSDWGPGKMWSSGWKFLSFRNTLIQFLSTKNNWT